MEVVVRSILVYELTDSVILLGLVNATRSVPSLLFSLVGGVLADRMDRRTLLVVAQSIHGCCGLTLGILVVAGVIQPWHFALMAFIEGTMGTVQQPARQAMTASVVEKKHLLNAVTLNSSNNRIARTAAPALAGVMAATTGPASALFLEAGLYAVAVVAISRVRFHDPVQLSEDERPSRPHGGPGGPWGFGGGRPGRRGQPSFIEGFKGYGYLRENPVVGWLVVLGLVPIVFSLANQTMAPVFAREVLDLGAGGVGLLLSAPGIGSVFGLIVVASLGDIPRKGIVSMAGIVAMGATAILFGLSPWVGLSLVALMLHGFSQTFYQTMNHTLVQLHTPDEYRGRVNAVYHMDRAFHPVGGLLIATIAQLWSPQLAMALSGLGCIVAVFLVGSRARAVRDLE
jgi:MFS family permease